MNSIDYYAYRSPIRSWNPLLKLVFILTLLILCITENRIPVSLYIAVSMGVITVWRGKVPFKEYAGLLSAPLVFIILGSLALMLEVGRKESGWYCYVTGRTVFRSVQVMMRAMGAVSACYCLTLSTPMGEIISALKRLHIPAVVIELMHLIYRYIFILTDTEINMFRAAKSRLGYCDFRTSCHTFGSSMGNLLVISLRKAGMYYDAMEARGYDGTLRFYEEPKPVKTGQLFLMGLYLISVIALNYL